jgi:hypothetical protein
MSPQPFVGATNIKFRHNFSVFWNLNIRNCERVDKQISSITHAAQICRPNNTMVRLFSRVQSEKLIFTFANTFYVTRTSQEIARILWNPTFHCRVTPLSWARRTQPTHPFPIAVRSIIVGLYSGGLFPSGFDIKSLYAILLLAVRSTFPSYLILLELVILVVYAEQYVLWSLLLNNSSSLLFQPPSVSKYSPLHPSSRSRLTVPDQVSATRFFEILRF